jgi:probable O-glycosylation ligase (exosortase A-associated)
MRVASPHLRESAIPGPGPAAAARWVGARQTARTRAGWTLSLLGLVAYLWVIHSQKLQLGQPAVVAGLVGLLVHRERVRLPGPLLWFAAFLVWASVGAAFSIAPAATGEALLSYWKIWLIALVACNVGSTPARWRQFVIAWLAIFAAYPVRGILFNMLSGISTQGRYAWNFIFSNPNDFATLTLPMLGLCVALLYTERHRWIRLAALVGTVLLPLVILFTQSRGGILALAAMGLLLLSQNRRRTRALGLVAVALGLGLLLAPPAVWNRLANLRFVTSETTIAQADEWGSAEQRSAIWKVARAIAADHPVLGVGIGAYPQANQEYVGRGRFDRRAGGERSAHSTYLTLLAETGVPGFLLFLGMLGHALVASRRVLRQLEADRRPAEAHQLRALVAGLAGFLLASVFATMQHVAFLYLYLGALTSYLALQQRHARALRPGVAPATRAGAPARARA